MARASIEQEVKLGVWPGFRLPELTDLAPWMHVDEASERVLDAVYHDADDLRLTRAGITLRHRTGEAEPTGRWTLKIPLPPKSSQLDRWEVSEDATAEAVPDDLARACRGVLRGAEPRPVAHLQTHRRTVALCDGGGRLLGEVADDEVSVIEAGRVAARFREVEVEAAPGAPPTLLALVVERLRMAGAGEPDPTPKLMRALGPRGLAQPDPAVASFDADAEVAAVVQAAMASSVRRLIAHDPVVRLDLGLEGVHQARVSTRRLRSDLRTFEPVLDVAWAEDLRAQLSWLADALGVVRDADVLGERLAAHAADLDPPDERQARHLLRHLARQRADHLRVLHEVYDSDRYLELLDTLVAAAREPHFTVAAEARASVVLPGLVAGPWRKLRRDARRLRKGATDEQLHALRIRAKRTRYAAEAAARALPEAEPFAEAVADLQGVLGDHQDAVVAEDWLRAAVDESGTRRQALAAGLLVARERKEAAAYRAQWLPAWNRVDRKRLTKWLG